MWWTEAGRHTRFRSESIKNETKSIDTRQEAEANGYNPNQWFDNVEIIAARRIGRETVTYVSNVFKYYVGYQLTTERMAMRDERHGEALNSCWADEDA